MVRKWKIALIVLVLGLLAHGFCEKVWAEARAGKESAKSTSPDQQEDAVRNILIALEKSFAAKNGESAGMLFAEDALFIDQSGDETRGRNALQARFDLLFKSAAPGIGIHPESISFPAGNVALIIGEVSRKQDQEDLPATRFSMVMTKTNNSWLINEVTEAVLQAAQTESQLQQLDWLVGQWSTDKSDASVQLNVEWAQGKKFITSKCILNKSGSTPQIDSQVIGWDPQHNCIVSWHFDSNGGFGNGVWSKQPKENLWTVNVTGVGADGSNTTASNTFSPRTPDEFIWQSIHRSIDGAAVADTEPITAHRVKP